MQIKCIWKSKKKKMKSLAYSYCTYQPSFHSVLKSRGVIQQQSNGFNKHRLAPVRFKDNLKRIKRKFQANSCGIFMVSVRVKIGRGTKSKQNGHPYSSKKSRRQLQFWQHPEKCQKCETSLQIPMRLLLSPFSQHSAIL